MGKKDAPDPPDYRGAAEEQAQASMFNTIFQTYANRPNQYTPWGSVEWNQTSPTQMQSIDIPGYGTIQVPMPVNGQMPQWEQNVTLNPELEAALEDQQAITRGRSDLALSMLGRSSDEFGPMVDWDSYTERGTAPTPNDYDTSSLRDWGRLTHGTPEQYLERNKLNPLEQSGEIRDRVENAIYERAASRLDPQFGQREQALVSQLRNQGLRPGDEAYDAAMGDFERERTDAYQTAMTEAIMGGGQEAARDFGMQLGRRGALFDERESIARNESATRQAELAEMLRTGGARFGEDLTSAEYASTTRQREIAEEMQRRGFSLNEINAILTGQQVGMPQFPNFMGATKADTPNYLGAAQADYGARLDAFNAEQSAWQGLMSGAAGLGGLFMPL